MPLDQVKRARLLYLPPSVVADTPRTTFLSLSAGTLSRFDENNDRSPPDARPLADKRDLALVAGDWVSSAARTSSGSMLRKSRMDMESPPSSSAGLRGPLLSSSSSGGDFSRGDGVRSVGTDDVDTVRACEKRPRVPDDGPLLSRSLEVDGERGWLAMLDDVRLNGTERRSPGSCCESAELARRVMEVELRRDRLGAGEGTELAAELPPLGGVTLPPPRGVLPLFLRFHCSILCVASVHDCASLGPLPRSIMKPSDERVLANSNVCENCVFHR